MSHTYPRSAWRSVFGIQEVHHITSRSNTLTLPSHVGGTICGDGTNAVSPHRSKIVLTRVNHFLECGARANSNHIQILKPILNAHMYPHILQKRCGVTLVPFIDQLLDGDMEAFNIIIYKFINSG